jgi:hypothetical protein
MSSAKSASDNIKKRVAIEPLRPRRNLNTKAIRPSPPEKKERLEIRGTKSASKKSKVPNVNTFVV